MELVDKNGYLLYLKFIFKGFRYRVVSTSRGANNSVWAGRDNVKNEDRGQSKIFTRKELKEYFKAVKPLND